MYYAIVNHYGNHTFTGLDGEYFTILAYHSKKSRDFAVEYHNYKTLKDAYNPKYMPIKASAKLRRLYKKQCERLHTRL